MGNFYFDESIHAKAGFILGSYVYTEEDINPFLEQALVKNEFIPFIDEFKSSSHMGRNPQQANLRGDLRDIVSEYCSIAVVIIPSVERETLGTEALKALKKVLEMNSFPVEQHNIFLDQNIFPSSNAAREAVQTINIQDKGEFYFEQDSKIVLGLQLADLVAHTCATMLLEAMGILNKQVKAGENSGYDPDLDIELGFELWAGIRYNFFSGDAPESSSSESIEDFEVEVSAYGLHIADSCSAELHSYAENQFGRMYLGCIH